MSPSDAPTPEIQHTLEYAQTFYANVVFASATGEEVVLSFGIRDNQDDQGRVKVTHRLAMTIPHFVRTVQLFDRIKSDLENKGLLKGTAT